MKQKIWTAIDRRLVRKAKLHAAQRGRPLSSVFEDALRAWLERAAAKPAKPSLVVGAAGNMAIDRAVLAAIMAEDLYDAP